MAKGWKTTTVGSFRYLVFIVILSLLALSLASYSAYNLNRVYSKLPAGEEDAHRAAMTYWVYLLMSLIVLIVLMFLYFCECQACPAVSFDARELSNMGSRRPQGNSMLS